MTCVKMTNSISAGFITQMITHHRAAIEMSKNLLCYNQYSVTGYCAEYYLLPGKKYSEYDKSTPGM